MKRTQIFTGLIALALIAAAAPADVSLINLAAADAEGEGVGVGYANGGIFRHSSTVPLDLRWQSQSNSNYTDTFMTIQGGNDDIQLGYNTGAQNPAFGDVKGTNTEDIQLGDVSRRMWDGIGYYEFLLLVNESANAAGEIVSVNEIRVYTSPTASLNTTVLADLGTLHWSLDGDGNNNRINLDYSLGSTGTNDVDMITYVPESLFAGVADTDYVYLYIEMGLDQYPGGIDPNDPAGAGAPTSAAAEEWLRFTVDHADYAATVPEPATMSLLALGGIAMLRGRRNRG